MQYILKIYKVKFYFHLLNPANSLLIDIFWLHSIDCYSGDYCLGCMIGPRHVAIDTYIGLPAIP